MVLTWSGIALGQSTVTGTVSSTDGESLIAASVLVKGTTQGVLTDLDGNYSIKVPAESTTLVFSYVGYGTQEFEIAGKSVINVTLSEGIEFDENQIIKGNTGSNEFEDYTTEYNGDLTKKDLMNLINEFQD
jgi:hypothetical protein